MSWEGRLRPLIMAVLFLAAFPAGLRADPPAPPADELKNLPNFGLDKRPNDYAVVIGIEKYRGTEIHPSNFSSGDAQLVADYLEALGFRRSNIHLLKDDFATRDDIRGEVEGWLPKVVKPNSTVVFYYSGHGAPDLTDPAKPEAYLVPYNGRPNELSYTGYAVEELKEKLGQLKAAKVVVILDSCFSGNGEHSMVAEGARPLMNQFTQVGEIAANMAILTATGSNQISTSDPDKGHGLLTYHFLKALKEGQTNLLSIYREIKPLVEDDAARLQTSGKQSPTLVLGDRQTPFFLADPQKIAEAKKKLEEANSEKARLRKAEEEKARIQEQVQQAQREKEAAQRKAEEAQAEADRKLQEQREQLEREAAERQAEQQRQFEEQKRQLERQRKTAPQEEPAYVPPTF